MRRHSPPRFGRRGSPPRKNRLRSVSPLSRNHSQALDERGRKHQFNSWEEPNSRKRMRSRSRERVLRGRDGNQDSFLEEEIRSRGFSKETSRKGIERSEQKSVDRDRNFYGSRMDDIRDKKHKRFSHENPNRGFDGNFGDHSRNVGHFGDVGGHNDLILDPSSVDFNPFVQEEERSLEVPHPPRIEPYIRHSERNERSDERIKRLEKLVEKLVEGNVKLPNQDESYGQSSKDVPELIPSNTKFTTSMWLNQIHEECVKRGFDEKTVIQYTQDRMTGIMKSWFKSVCNYDFTWPELKLLITKTFPDNVEFASTLKLLVSRDKTSDETITQYYFSKVYLCEACKITGENAVSCLIDGLSNPFMKQDIKTYKFLTPEVLYSEYLSKFPDNEIPVRLEEREVVPSYNNEEYIPLEAKKSDYISKSSRKDRVDKRKCFTCKKLGHTTLECRHAPICYNCKKKGHIAAKCHFNVLLIPSNKESLQTLKCKINGYSYMGVFDTGSAEVIVKKSIGEKLNLKPKPSNTILKGFGGKNMKAMGEATVHLEVNNVKRQVQALVMPDDVLDWEVIIGQTYFSQEVGALLHNGTVEVFEFPKGANFKLI